MILKKQHLLEMINIGLTTRKFYDDLTEYFGTDSILLYDTVYGSFYNFFSGFFSDVYEQVFDEAFNDDKIDDEDISPDDVLNYAISVVEGLEDYKDLTLEQRLEYLCVGPCDKISPWLTEEIDTTKIENCENFEAELQHTYKQFTGLKNGLIKFICGEGVEIRPDSPLASIQRSYDYLLSNR